MIRRKVKNSFYLTIFLIIILSISTGYALLNSTLIIMGTSAIQKNTWDVHYENLKVKEGSVTATTEPSITDSNRISNFTFVLDKRGDFYEFTVDIVNNGSLDAMIDSIEKTPALTSEQEKYLTYTITYENSLEIKKNQLVKVNDFVKIKVRVEFKSDITASDLPQTQQVLNLGFHINYIQADNSGVSVTNNGILKVKPIANGDINEIGTIVTIGDQQFYTIGTDGDNVKLLSMYNLYVGGEYNSGWTVYGSDATGKQDSTMLGNVSGQSVRKGTTDFSSSTQKGTNYSDYNGSIVEGYVNAYKDILEGEEYGVPVVEARLITKEELTSNDIGCNADKFICSSAPSFIYSTTYWSGSAYDNEYVWGVDCSGNFSKGLYSYAYHFGVRPVIVINKNLIDVNINILEFNVNGVSYQYEEGMTWEEWINSKYNIAEAETDGTYIYFYSENIGTNNTCINSSDIINNNLNYQIVFEQCAI